MPVTCKESREEQDGKNQKKDNYKTVKNKYNCMCLALVVFLVLVVVGIGLLSIIVSQEKQQSLPEATVNVLKLDKDLLLIALRLLLFIDLAFVIISFSVCASPLFYNLIASNTNPGTISTFDIIDLLTNAILAAVIAYMSVELAINKRP